MPSLLRHLPVTLRRDLRSAGAICALLVAGVLALGTIAGSVLAGSPVPHRVIAAVSGGVAKLAHGGPEPAQARKASAHPQPVDMTTAAVTPRDEKQIARPVAKPSSHRSHHRRSVPAAQHAPRTAARPALTPASPAAPASTPAPAAPAPAPAAPAPAAPQPAPAAPSPAIDKSPSLRLRGTAQPSGGRGGRTQAQRVVVQASPTLASPTPEPRRGDARGNRGRFGAGRPVPPAPARPAPDHGRAPWLPGAANPAPSPTPAAPAPAPAGPQPRDGGWGHGHGDDRGHWPHRGE